MLRDLGAAVTVGSLVTAVWAAPPGDRSRPGHLAGGQRAAVRLAAVGAVVWSLSGVASEVFRFADLVGLSPAAPGFGRQFVAYALEPGLGREATAALAVVLVLAVLSATVRSITGAGISAVLGVIALWPVAASGHAASSTNHEASVSSLFLHLVAVSVWVGGLLAVLVVGRAWGPHLTVVVSRFSQLAVIAVVVIALSGAINGALRLGSPAGLVSTYGLLLLGKTALLLMLVLIGQWHRAATIPSLGEGRAAPFVRWAVGEGVLMAAVLGVAAVLADTAPPASSVSTTAAESLLGYPLPPELTAAGWFTQWRPDLLFTGLAATLAVLYLAAVIRLHGRGDRWPVMRTVSWIAGCLALAYVTSGAPAVYGQVLFSMHMVQHMALTMLVPPLLVLGAPITVGLRALSARRDGSRGAREWLVVIVHSPVLRVLVHPVVAPLLFSVSLIGFYYSPAFDIALRSYTGHLVMIVHFLLVGYLFSSMLIGIDPVPNRPPHLFRLIILIATVAFHAFFGIALMTGDRLLGAEWFAAVTGSDAEALLTDQRLGGALAWGLGDFPSALLTFALGAAWIRDDAREARRYDRQAARDGDARLATYNAGLAELARRTSPAGADTTRPVTTRTEDTT